MSSIEQICIESSLVVIFTASMCINNAVFGYTISSEVSKSVCFSLQDTLDPILGVSDLIDSDSCTGSKISRS